MQMNFRQHFYHQYVKLTDKQPFLYDDLYTFAITCHLHSPNGCITHKAMITKTLKRGIKGMQNNRIICLLLFLVQVSLMQAAPANANNTAKTSEGVSVIEILGYVGMVLGVILLAWLIGSAQSKGSSSKPSTNHVAPRPPRHFNHPNDPHFRKLRKKTS